MTEEHPRIIRAILASLRESGGEDIAVTAIVPRVSASFFVGQAERMTVSLAWLLALAGIAGTTDITIAEFEVESHGYCDTCSFDAPACTITVKWPQE